MRRHVLLSVSLLLAFIFILFGSLTASACEPGDDDPFRCITLRPPKARLTAKATPRPTTAPAVALAVLTQKGSSPSDAMDPADTWTTIAAGTGVWYKIGGGKNPMHLEVWLDAYGKDGIGFSVYSPEQYTELSQATPAKGRGTVNKADLRHDLWWIGNAPAGGTWYVLVTNTNSVPIAYKLGYNGAANAQRDCTGPYWEYLPNGAYVLWPGLCK